MKFCKKCAMPSTRPGISFNEEGICSGCVNHEKKKNIDWAKRFEELKALADKYRGMNGDGPDCMIAVSGGKDSHYQVHLFKEVLGMNPILVTAEDNMTLTQAGISNLKNITETFDCDLIALRPRIKTQKKVMRYTFEKYGKPTWYVDRLIYTFPLHMAIKWNTPLLIYGENVSYEYGGQDAVETYSARDQIENGVASSIDFEELKTLGVTERELSLLKAPSEDALQKLDPMYVSYFMEWNSYNNYRYAKTVGFKDLKNEWIRTNHVEDFDQVDSIGYLVHAWLKYPKFGHAAATDYASRFVRYGMLTREEAVELVEARDHDLDQRSVDDFCSFTGYTRREFWDIVSKHYNQHLFEKNHYGVWQLKQEFIQLRRNPQ